MTSSRTAEIRRALSGLLHSAKTDPLRHAGERWQAWMLLGEFERAWQESDLLGASFGNRKPLETPHLVVRCLRGFGDAIQFLRYVDNVNRCCRRVTVQANPRLVPLLRQAASLAEVVAWEEPILVAHGCSLECSDLPYLFRSTISTIPHPLALSGIRAPDPSANGPMRIGVSWTAGAWNPSRSIPFELLAPFWKIRDVSFVSLEQDTEGCAIPSGIHVHTGERSLVDTARLISSLDLVITVDTMVAHLAGTLGTLAWVMLPFACDWRWMIDREDSPWYPSLRLFRQPRPGDWAYVVHAIASRLHRMLNVQSFR